LPPTIFVGTNKNTNIYTLKIPKANVSRIFMGDNTYSCPRCGYHTKLLCNFKKHLQIKSICPPNIADVSLDILKQSLITTKDKSFVCDVCNRKYSSKETLRVHLKKCKDSSNGKVDLEAQIHRMNEELAELKKKFSTLESEKPNVVINGNIHTQNNISISLQPNQFLSENMDYIDDDYVIHCAKRLDSGLIDLIRNIRFNPDHPENMNVKMHRSKQKTLYVFRNDKWEICDAKWTLEEMIVHGARILYQKMLTNVDEEKLLQDDTLESKVNSWLLSVLPKNNEKIMGKLSRGIYALILSNQLLLVEENAGEIDSDI